MTIKTASFTLEAVRAGGRTGVSYAPSTLPLGGSKGNEGNLGIERSCTEHPSSTVFAFHSKVCSSCHEKQLKLLMGFITYSNFIKIYFIVFWHDCRIYKKTWGVCPF